MTEQSEYDHLAARCEYLQRGGIRDAARIKKLEADLLECLEWFKKQYDVVDGLNGPEPNIEMRLGTMIDETLNGPSF